MNCNNVYRWSPKTCIGIHITESKATIHSLSPYYVCSHFDSYAFNTNVSNTICIYYSIILEITYCVLLLTSFPTSDWSFVHVKALHRKLGMSQRYFAAYVIEWQAFVSHASYFIYIIFVSLQIIFIIFVIFVSNRFF